MDTNKLTAGEALAFVKGMKELGVVRAKFGDLEFELAAPFALPASHPNDEVSEFETAEDHEAKAKKIRAELHKQLFEAS